MTNFPQLLVLNAQSPLATAQLKEALLEPVVVTAVAFFWLAALPLGAAFSAAIVLYDRIAGLNSTALRLPHLQSHAATSPLLLRRKSFTRRHEFSRRSSRDRFVRA